MLLRSNDLDATSPISSRPQTATTPSERLEKLQQQKRLQQSKMKQRQVSGQMQLNINMHSGNGNESTGNVLMISPNSLYKNGSEIDEMLNERGKEKDLKRMSEVEREMKLHGVASVFDPTPPVLLQSSIDFSDMRLFLNNPAPREILRCYIVRKEDASSFGSVFGANYPIYELYTKEDTFLMAAVKRCYGF